MHRFLALSGTALFAVVLLSSFVERAEAAPATNPNNVTSPNFRRAIGNERYRYSKRRIEASDQFTTASGSNSTFDRRADYLRQAKLKLIQEELDAREFSGERRSSPTYYERDSRSAETSLRRINEAQRRGGIRLRRGTASLRQLGGLNREEKQQRINEYRQQVKEAETNRYQYDSEGCSEFTGRRQALCRYKEMYGN